jgi:hypothetical protein
VIGGLFAGADEILFVSGWKWIFLMNVPIGALAIFLVWKFLHVPHTPVNHRIDWLGAGTIVVGVVPMLLVAENGRDWGWGSALSISMYALSIIGIVSFILAERKAGDEAILPLKLFSNRTFTLTTILGVIVGVGMFGGMMTLPLMLQIVNGVTPTESGLLMLPMVLGMMTATMISGQITSRTGQYKVFMVVGTGMLTAGYASLFGYQYDTPIWALSLSMDLIGMGLGQLMQTLTLAAQNAVEAKDIGVATSSTMFFRQMGGTLGVAVFISILFNRLPDAIKASLGNKEVVAGLSSAATDSSLPVETQQMAGGLLAASQNPDLFDQLSANGPDLSTDSSFLTNLDPRVARPFLMGFADSTVAVFVSAAAVVAIAFVLSWFIKALPLRTKSAAEEAADAAAMGH